MEKSIVTFTVKRLIEELSKLPDNELVYIEDNNIISLVTEVFYQNKIIDFDTVKGKSIYHQVVTLKA